MPKKKAKGKKKASTKEVQNVKPPPDPSDHYIRRFQIWAKSNSSRIFRLCQHLDTDVDNPGCLTLHQFLGCLFDLQAPITRDELQKICSFLSNDNKGSMINFVKFIDDIDSGQLLMSYVEPGSSEQNDKCSDPSNELVGGANHMPLKTVHYQCTDCNILRTDIPVEVNPMVVNVSFVLSTFHNTPAHPGHFNASVLASQTVEGLKMIIKDHLQGSVRSVALFKELPCVEKNFMRPHHNLERYISPAGGEGSWDSVVNLNLYYDYSTDFEKDAVLMAENGLFQLKTTGLHVKNL